MKTLHPIMFAGTGSDVGKSIVAAAFCRIFKQDGYNWRLVVHRPYKLKQLVSHVIQI